MKTFPVHGERADFTRLVLCGIEADFLHPNIRWKARAELIHNALRSKALQSKKLQKFIQSLAKFYQLTLDI